MGLVADSVIRWLDYFKSLAIYNNESLTSSIKIDNKYKSLPKLNKPYQNLSKTFKSFPKWQIFAKSGHAGLTDDRI